MTLWAARLAALRTGAALLDLRRECREREPCVGASLGVISGLDCVVGGLDVSVAVWVGGDQDWSSLSESWLVSSIYINIHRKEGHTDTDSDTSSGIASPLKESGSIRSSGRSKVNGSSNMGFQAKRSMALS